MHAWEAIQQSVDYIEENIKEELSIEELANVSYLSMYYFQKLFSRLVGKTVKEYIKARRVANAKPLLKATNLRIADIALEYGFNSHESFTKAFKEIYCITPEAYRRNNLLLTDFLKPDLSIYYTMVDEDVPLMVDDMVLEINQRVLKETEYYTGVSKKNRFKRNEYGWCKHLDRVMGCVSRKKERDSQFISRGAIHRLFFDGCYSWKSTVFCRS